MFPPFALAHATFADLRAGHPEYIVRFHEPRFIAQITTAGANLRLTPHMIDDLFDDYKAAKVRQSAIHGLMFQAAGFYATGTWPCDLSNLPQPEVLIDPHLELPEWLLCDSGSDSGSARASRAAPSASLGTMGGPTNAGEAPAPAREARALPRTFVVHTAAPIFWCEIIQTSPSKEHPLGQDMVANLASLPNPISKSDPEGKPRSPSPLHLQSALHFYQTFMPDSGSLSPPPSAVVLPLLRRTGQRGEGRGEG